VRNLSAGSQWWDDKSTKDVVETRDDILAASFKAAVTELEKTLGNDSSKWKWGSLHISNFRNATFGESGVGVIENLFNRGPYPTSGGGSIVNATSWDGTEGYETTDLPSMRAIYDLSNLSNSLTVHTTGESGHAYNKHYDDLIPLWASIKYYPMLWDEQSATQDPEGHLALKPK
jgi:penicillin amidase